MCYAILLSSGTSIWIVSIYCLAILDLLNRQTRGFKCKGNTRVLEKLSCADQLVIYWIYCSLCNRKRDVFTRTGSFVVKLAAPQQQLIVIWFIWTFVQHHLEKVLCSTSDDSSNSLITVRNDLIILTNIRYAEISLKIFTVQAVLLWICVFTRLRYSYKIVF